MHSTTLLLEVCVIHDSTQAVNPPIISCAPIILDWFTLLMMALFLGLHLNLFLIAYGTWKWRLGLTAWEVGTRLIVGKWASPYISLLHDTLWCISASCDFCCQCIALTGGLFRVTSGLKPTIGGMVLGTLLRYIYQHMWSHCMRGSLRGVGTAGSLDCCSRVIGLFGPNIAAMPVPSCCFFKAI